MTREELIEREAKSLLLSINTNENTRNSIYDALLTMTDYIDSHPKNPWISVEDRLPKEGECVFVRYGDVTHPLYSSAYMIEKDLWSIEGYGNGEITHWMQVPELKGE